ncbi:MAG: M48 family metallopeptidase [Candidatus Riflebacteria bacterium]|nr:M48 family metallopeptidase [Candidatus Riflebacteria bacterium]
MNKSRYAIIIFLMMLACNSPASAKNVLAQILGAYQTYQEVNMTLWLVGDVGAEKRFGKELQFWMGLTQKPEKDPKINAYVKGIFDRLLPHFKDRGMKYDIRVIRESSANAFVIPGGHVYVHSGLLDMVDSDDELAAVISHELGHAERRHSLANFRASTVAMAILDKAVKNKRDRETWGALLGYLTLMKFSRKQEDEADDIGQMRLARAGFNPAAQVTLWEKFLKKHGDTKGLQQYLSSHPPSSERVQNARNNLAKMNVAEQRVFANTRQIMTIERTNLINNNSFEAASTTTGLIQGWEITEGNAGVSDRAASSGRRALQMWPAQRQVATRVLSDFIAVNEASDFAFSIWARSENGQQNAAVGVELYDANRRLRNRIWAIRPSALLGAGWQKIEARLVNTKEKRLFAANNAFMRIVLQTGPFSEGSVLFDDLSLRPFLTPEPANLLAGGDFERADPDGKPEGINGPNNLLSIDYEKFNTGYASLRLKATASGESGFAFAPLASQNLKAGQQIACSFFFQADRQQKGMVVVEMLDANQKTLARRLAQYEFEAVADRWQATSFSWKFDIQKEEEALVKAIQVRVAANMAVGASLWLDTMVMR